jgi:16S rRNA (guanine966-N2)-methyltransferase
LKHQLNQVRIIAGKWRGRRVSFPNVAGLRPTPDRVRETLFNWLSHAIVDAHCLDLFAGSGILSLEALSRGAASVVSVEKNTKAISAINESAQLLGIESDQLSVVLADAVSWLQQKSTIPFDVVFLDPPYSLDLLPTCIKHLSENGWLKAESWVYFEHNQSLEEKLLPVDWQVIKSKRAGHVYYYLVQICL